MQIYSKYNTFGQTTKNNKTLNLNNNEADIKLKYPFHYGKNILLDLPLAVSAYSSLKKDEKFLKSLVVLTSIVFGFANIGEINIKKDSQNNENNLKKVKAMLVLKQFTELSFSLLSAFAINNLNKKDVSNKKAKIVGLGVLTVLGAIASIANNTMAYHNFKKENQNKDS